MPSLPLFSSSVSPELLGVLSSIAAFIALMALFFLYLSNKLSVETPDELSHLSTFNDNQQGAHTPAWLHTHTPTHKPVLGKFYIHCEGRCDSRGKWGYLC